MTLGNWALSWREGGGWVDGEFQVSVNTKKTRTLSCLAAEFVGTFALIFVGCGAIMVDEISGGQLGHLGVATAFGLVIMVMIFATGHISEPTSTRR